MILTTNLLARINNFISPTTAAPTAEQIKDFTEGLQTTTKQLRDEGTKLARNIVNNASGSSSEAATTLHNATTLLNTSVENSLKHLDQSVCGPISEALNSVKLGAQEMVKNFIDFFSSPEAILKSQSGLSTSNADDLLAAMAR